MWKGFKRWPVKIKNNKLLVIGGIATPVLISIVLSLELLNDRKPHLDDDGLPQEERTTLTHQHPQTLMRDLGIIAMGAAGLFLLLNRPFASKKKDIADFSGTDLSGTDLKDTNFSKADLSGTNLNGTDLSGANLRDANLTYANLNGADLSGADLSDANLRYANLTGANLRYANLTGADLRYANLRDADLNCALLSDANFSDANLSGALLFFINSRDVKNLEPLQLKAKPSPFLCHVALPSYSQKLGLNPNRDCHLMPQLLSDRYDISLEEAKGIVKEARRHQWH